MEKFWCSFLNVKNKLLHALSNRAGPFPTEQFSQSPTFVPKTLTPGESALRHKLFLDVVDTDYYLRVYLALLHSFPDVTIQFNDTVKTYQVEDFNARGVDVSGGDLVSAPNIKSFFTDAPVTSLPVNLTYTIGYIDHNALELRALETGLIQKVSYHSAGIDPNKILRFHWPRDFPFHGPLRLTQNWIPGASIQITVSPSNFPYRLLWKEIAGNMYLNKLLLDQNLFEAFNSTIDMQEKLMLALTVLASSNTSIFPA